MVQLVVVKCILSPFLTSFESNLIINVVLTLDPLAYSFSSFPSLIAFQSRSYNGQFFWFLVFRYFKSFISGIIYEGTQALLDGLFKYNSLFLYNHRFDRVSNQLFILSALKSCLVHILLLHARFSFLYIAFIICFPLYNKFSLL